MGQAATHHPDVRRHRDRLEAEALEDPDVGAVVSPVAGVEALVVPVAAVRVLHHELAHPDQAAPRTRLVPELRLEVIEPDRQLPIRADDVAQEVGDDLLVGHRDHHVAVAAILEPGHLRPDLVVPAGFAPEVGRMDHRHLELLAADRVHLLADHLLDPLRHPVPERQQRIQPGTQLAHVTGAQEQAVGWHLRIGGIITQGGKEELAEAHAGKDTGAGPTGQVGRRKT